MFLKLFISSVHYSLFIIHCSLFAAWYCTQALCNVYLTLYKYLLQCSHIFKDLEVSRQLEDQK